MKWIIKFLVCFKRHKDNVDSKYYTFHGLVNGLVNRAMGYVDYFDLAVDGLTLLQYIYVKFDNADIARVFMESCSAVVIEILSRALF